MKDFFVWLVATIIIVNLLWYAFQIIRHKIDPALSTWIIFSLSTGLSLTTYVIAENWDFRSNILNTLDFVVCTITVVVIAIWSRDGVRFKPFEKWYLLGIGLIIAYGLITGDAWHSNLLTQVMVTIGYAPTLQNLMTAKRNTESFLSWGGALLTAIISLYPAIIGGNTLSAVYSIRAVIFVSAMLAVMYYYHHVSKQNQAY